MRSLSYLFIGILFGITMFKVEAASWFRIFEMFQFKSFHMYGIIGSALFLGVIITQFIKSKQLKDAFGTPITIAPKEKTIARYLIGGTFFGLGWALSGACPGPMYTLVGAGFSPILVVIFGAVLGTFVYGVLKKYLPH